MGFQKGRKKTGGRQPGTPNAATSEFEQAAQDLLRSKEISEPHKRWVKSHPDGALSLFLYGHAFGKPKERHEHDVEHSGGIVLTWRTRPSK